MNQKTSVFQKTYTDYIYKVFEMDFAAIEEKLGVQVKDQDIMIPLLDQVYCVSKKGIFDASGKKPALDICVILCRYLLLCPEQTPEDKEWVSFKDFKDSNPLINYFSNDVERKIARAFSKKTESLKSACVKLNGRPSDLQLSYDVSFTFNLLPKMPLLMLFNDADDDFEANCTVLFERRAEVYLDAECLAMLGWQLFSNLKKGLKEL